MSEKRKLVIDTNILISGIFWGGKPFKLLELWMSRKVEVYITPEILEEYLEVILRVSGDQKLANKWEAAIVKNSKITSNLK